ncbi:uncharacterized protein LOC110876194 [Helianthus annuus]|uniref:uncharacterized protein LOC110876194 n=1 Tax=Helianthus annuus TaxID=4232 RepID=UPI000B8F42F0|nr:uncharacterized protein LOC110876194 [Helianthus annuus]
MDQFTCSYTESSSSSSYEQQQQQQQHQQHTLKLRKPSYHNSLHSVHKPLALRKPTVKHFIAPLPPTPLKIYHVEPSNFKEVVRMLTSTPKFQYSASHRLKDKAPPPLVLSVPKPTLSPKPTTQPPPSPPLDGGGMMSPLSNFIMSPDFCNLLNETMQTSTLNSSIPAGMDCFEDWSPDGLGLSPKSVGHDPFGGALMSPMGLGLSPASFSWCSSVLFSPGTHSVVNQSSVL